MTVGVVVAGFGATQRNILLGLRFLKLYRWMEEVGYKKEIVRCLKEGIFIGIGIASITSLHFIFDTSSVPLWIVWTIWFGAVSLLFGVIVRNELLMFRIFQWYVQEQAKRVRPESGG